MAGSCKQILAVVSTNLSSLPHRLGSSLVVVASVAGVVGVLLSVLALGEGLSHTLKSTARYNRAIITSDGAVSEGASSIARDVARQILSSEGIIKNGSGNAIGSMESLAQVQLKDNSGVLKDISLRGVGPLAADLRPEIHIIEGRTFRTGRQELIVGQSIANRFKGVAIGERLDIQQSKWLIVGVFKSQNDGAHDSELFGDADTLLAAFHRNSYQSVVVQLSQGNGLSGLKHAIANNPLWSVKVETEAEFYARQSQELVSTLKAIGYLVGVIMGVGTTFAVLNTMHAAISDRSVEIATFRAIGFNGIAVLTAVFAEAFLLALAGAILGVVFSWVLFSGRALSMLAASQSQLVFAPRFTPSLVLVGVAWALIMGFFGGLFPAVQAARLSVINALRAT